MKRLSASARSADQRAFAEDDRRIPVVVLTGFLGAGKTTVLNHLLGQPELSGTAVLINEFGDVAVDHHLVDHVDETVVVLDSGCICCSIQDDLARTLKLLFQRAQRREISQLDRIVIETTGLADPAPVIYTLMRDPFIGARFRCDGVVTVVDATHGDAQLDSHGEAVRQVVMADRLLLSKCDLAATETQQLLSDRLARLNPGAGQLKICPGQVPREALAGCGLYDPAGKPPDVARWLSEARPAPPSPYAPAARVTQGRSPSAHDQSIQSHVLVFEQPLDWLGFSDGLGLILQVYGARTLRIKGLLNVQGDPLPRIVQCVQHAAYPPSSLSEWPETPPFDDRCSRVVFIVRDLPVEELVSILGSLAGQAPRVGT